MGVALGMLLHSLLSVSWMTRRNVSSSSVSSHMARRSDAPSPHTASDEMNVTCLTSLGVVGDSGDSCAGPHKELFNLRGQLQSEKERNYDLQKIRDALKAENEDLRKKLSQAQTLQASSPPSSSSSQAHASSVGPPAGGILQIDELPGIRVQRKVLGEVVAPEIQCPMQCYGNPCVDGKCVCDSQFKGADCSFWAHESKRVPRVIPPSIMKELSGHTFSHSHIIMEKMRILSDALTERNFKHAYVPPAAGDIVELGVFKGGSAAGFAYTMDSVSPHKKLWLYDTFAGHPKGLSDALNPSFRGKKASTYADSFVGTLDEVREAIHHAGFNDSWIDERVVFKKGYFNVTMLDPIPEAIAVLHIDCDWYECTLDAFRRFYDRVSCGGAVIMDDYGVFAGQRQAFFDFVVEKNFNPKVQTFGTINCAYFEKICPDAPAAK